MELWTDYEGVTIDGAFPLKKLLMPEGRSAFFATSGVSGEATVVRLIECHFDEEEILSRWRGVEALSHPNFLKFERYGQTEVDGRPVVYAVFEKVDGNLAEVLDQGVLTVPDVAQLASSLVSALEVLHTHGYVHEHIEPRNIFAIGSVVKLRGDCIREAPEGEEGHALKQRDVHDLATVLLQGLTQKDSIEGVPDSALPAPFGQMIRKGLDGSWGVEDIRAALGRQFGANRPVVAEPVKAAVVTAVVEPKVASGAAKPVVRTEAQMPLPLLEAERSAGAGRVAVRKDHQEEESFSMRRLWIGAGVAALVLLLCGWLLVHAWGAHRQKAAQGGVVSQGAQPSLVTPAPVVADSPRATVPATSGAGWRVITFTYDRRVDAEKKVSDLARTHPELTPVVFTPSGHAPFLVAIGGVMDREAAYALARRSRSLGLPHDMYAQNYSR
jgi:hypothetical protein